MILPDIDQSKGQALWHWTPINRPKVDSHKRNAPVKSILKKSEGNWTVL